MKIKNNEYFNITVLLRRDDLNIRKFAASAPDITVSEYFDMLSTFLNLAPGVELAIYSFANLKGEKEDYKTIDNMIKLLERMGCTKFIIDFHSILSAYGKKGNWREAAARAKQITEEFRWVYFKIKAARIDMTPENLTDAYISLGEYIRQLEEEANIKPTILAVDDSSVILKSVSSVLSDKYKVFTLPKPMELEKVLQKLIPDLFLLDYNMPEINGFDLVPIIRNFDEHKDTPIIFLTAEGTMDTLTAAMGLGACDFVVKPFKPDTLREKIAKHIVRKKVS